MAQVQRVAPPFLGNLVEICIVTRNHRRTIDGLLRLEFGPFQVHTFTAFNVTQQHYRGRPSSFSLKVCFAKQGSLTWEIMEPIGDDPSIMADFLAAQGEGIHYVAFDCNAIPVAERKEEFSRRGFELVQEGIWHGKEGTYHFCFFDTEGATRTCFKSYNFSPDWEDPEDTIWYPHRPSAGAIAAPTQSPSSIATTRLVPLGSGTTGILRAGHGASACLAKGQSLKIINTGGRQVVDFFAFTLPPDFQPLAASSLGYLSMNHTRTKNLHRDPKVGDALFNNLRQPLLYFGEDSSPRLHDSLIPACDPERYRQLGVQGYHRSCAENLKNALSDTGVLNDLFPGLDVLTSTPAPFNLFMNVSMAESGDLKFLPGKGKGGDFVILGPRQTVWLC